MRLIDADKLFDVLEADKVNLIRSGYNAEQISGLNMALCSIAIAPTVEAATKHGRWIDMGDFCSCSICQATRLKEVATHYGKAVWLETPFCPSCGAKMDK